MADDNKTSDDATILPADYTLLRKIGGASLDVILSAEVIKNAEAVITEAAGGLYAECVDEAEKLQGLIADVKKGGDIAAAGLVQIAAVSFAIKTKAGQAGFSLVATLAMSLQNLCEKTKISQLTPAILEIIEWHSQSLTQMLALKITGDGGEVGKAILAEMEKLPV